MLARPCRSWREAYPSTSLLQLVRPKTFHTSASLLDNGSGLPDHYATLDVSPDASPGEIKKKFYTLSKSHHPDLHPNDPTASTRFVQISEAYATLGSPEKRSRYDRDFLRANPSTSSTNNPRGGSYSSATSSTPFGGRPASGLSRRRTQFRGPPPSFYRSGGWGSFSEKRSENAEKASHTAEAQGRAQSNNYNSSYESESAAGTGPGGFSSGFSDDVPHFDSDAHRQTQTRIERTRHRARRKREVRREDSVEDGAGGSSTWVNFVVVAGMVLGVGYVGGLFNSSADRRKRKEEGM